MYDIDIHKVGKTYKNGIQALCEMSIKVKSGEIFTLLGENGAGKSTLIKVLTTFLKPTTGKINMLGKDIQIHSAFIRSNIACVSQHTSIDTHLSLQENMLFQAKLYKVPKSEAQKRMMKLINDFDLKSYLQYPVSSYSGGIKRRLDIAMNMMSNPKILFLDEPTVGMDIQSRKVMWDMIKKIKNDLGTTIFLTTHYLEEADILSDTICIMKEGREIIQGSPFELKKYLKRDNIEIKLSSKKQVTELVELLKSHQDVCNIEVRNFTVVVLTKNTIEIFYKLISYLIDNKISFCGIDIVQPTLEDVFLRLTEKELTI